MLPVPRCARARECRSTPDQKVHKPTCTAAQATCLKSERRKWRPVARPQPQGPGPSLRLVQCDLNDRPGPGGRGVLTTACQRAGPGPGRPRKKRAQNRDERRLGCPRKRAPGPQQPGAPGLSSTRVTGPRAARGRPDCRLGVQGCRRIWPRTGPRRMSDAAAVPAMADRCHARLLRILQKSSDSE